MMKLSPITEAILTVEALDGRDKAAALLCEFIGELERVYRAREAGGGAVKMTPSERVEKYKALQLELNAIHDREEVITAQMDDLWKVMGHQEEDQVDPDWAGFRTAVRANNKKDKKD